MAVKSGALSSLAPGPMQGVRVRGGAHQGGEGPLLFSGRVLRPHLSHFCPAPSFPPLPLHWLFVLPPPPLHPCPPPPHSFFLLLFFPPCLKVGHWKLAGHRDECAVLAARGGAEAAAQPVTTALPGGASLRLDSASADWATRPVLRYVKAGALPNPDLPSALLRQGRGAP